MTEKEHPYRPTPSRMNLQPRAATVVAAGQSVNGREHIHRVVEALPVGEGNLVTVTELRWTTTGDPQGPGLGRFHLASIPVVPELRRECTTFYTTLKLEQIRSAFFEEAQLVKDG